MTRIETIYNGNHAKVMEIVDSVALTPAEQIALIHRGNYEEIATYMEHYPLCDEARKALFSRKMTVFRQEELAALRCKNTFLSPVRRVSMVF